MAAALLVLLVNTIDYPYHWRVSPSFRCRDVYSMAVVYRKASSSAADSLDHDWLWPIEAKA